MDIVKNISLLTVSLLTALYGSCIYSTDLTDAAKNGDLELVNALILSGANVDERDADGVTALHVAACNDHLDIINALIVAGANINEQDDYGSTPLHYATYNGYMTIAQALIDAGADVNHRDSSGQTPLHYAIYNPAILDMLIAAGANINQQDHDDLTALHHAAFKGYMTIAQALIAAGADLNITEIHGFTPLKLAQQHGGHPEMVELLADYQQRIYDAEQRARDHVVANTVANTVALATQERLGADSPLFLLSNNVLLRDIMPGIIELIVNAEDHDARQPRPVGSTIK